MTKPMDSPVGTPPFLMDRENALQRLDRLVRRVLGGLCVPFLGAGVSQGARRLPATDPSITLKAPEIARNMRQRLSEAAAVTRDTDGGHARTLEFLARTLPHAPTPNLGEVAELAFTTIGPEETCKVLGLEDWRGFEVPRSHRYLAMLVREGLLREILETNYDAFMEDAVHDTYGGEQDGAEAARVIHDLATYRTYMAEPPGLVDGCDRALVKIVKLNGCATAYAEGARSPCPLVRRKAAEAIVLTEAQLQAWGAKRWARDCLADRLRSRCILFVGFGSQDPIVRHRAVEVMREFGDDERDVEVPARGEACERAIPETCRGKDNRSGRSGAWWNFPNAPFMAAYGEVSFHQFQILRSFADAHDRGRRGEHDRVDHIERNAFAGVDAAILTGVDHERKLDAGDFLGEVAIRAISRLARDRFFSSESPLHSYLRGALATPEMLLRGARRTWFDEVGSEGTVSHFARWLRLARNRPYVSMWSRICMAIRAKVPRRGAYRPFADSPVKQPMLLLLAHLIDPGLSKQAPHLRGRIHRGAFRLSPRRSGRTPPPEHALFAVSDLSDWDRRCADIPDGAVVIVLGGGSIPLQKRQVRVRTPRKGASLDRQQWVREVYVVGDLNAITGSNRGGAPSGEAADCLAALKRDPWRHVREQPASWRQRCRKEGR